MSAPSKFAWPLSTAAGRWATLGPYYAMFPVPFVRFAVDAFCPPDGAVLDPFCGRGTVPYVARVTGRPSLGVDLNEVAWVFAAAKTDPEPSLDRLLVRIAELSAGITVLDEIPENEFQRMAWSPRVLGYLNAARRMLDWRGDRLDRTVMALILVHLHGKAGNAMSTQMRQSKSMAPDYAVRWWTEREMRPPEMDPVDYLRDRARWRYRHGVPTGAEARTVLGDARMVLPRARRRFSLLLTSPPYYNVTNYTVDNWIRLWMLGGPALPSYLNEQRHADRERYAKLLRSVFAASRKRLEDDAVVYVRTDSRRFTRDLTYQVLAALWPGHQPLARRERPSRSQTRLFGDMETKPGETDFLMLPAGRRGPVGYTPFEAGRETEPEAENEIKAA